MQSEPNRDDGLPDTSLRSDDTVLNFGEDTALNLGGDTVHFNRAPAVSSELLIGVHLHHAQLFAASGERLLHSIVNVFAHGIFDSDYKKLRDANAAELDVMAKEIRALMVRGDIILDRIIEQVKEKRIDKISASVSQELYPLLSELDSFVERSYKFNMDIAKEWVTQSSGVRSPIKLINFLPDEDTEGPETPNPRSNTDFRTEVAERHINTYAEIKESLSQYNFAANPAYTSIDANQFLLNLPLRFPCEVSFSSLPCSIEMDRSHLELASSMIMKELLTTAHSIRTTAIARGFSENDILSLSEDEIRDSKAFAQIREAFFGRTNCEVSIIDSDYLAFDIPVPDCFVADWKKAVRSFDSSLGTVNHLLKQYHGEALVSFIPDDKRLRVSLSVPIRKNETARSGDDCSAEYYSRPQNRYRLDEAMINIAFDRQYVDHERKEATYRVEANGSALLTPEARAHMRNILDRADLFMRFIPGLESVELRALGTAAHIEKAFDQGSVGIVLHGTRKDNFRAYRYIHDRLSWEKKDEASEREESGDFSNKQRISFNSTLFFDEPIRHALVELAKVAKLSQVPCEHDQEQRFGSTPEATNDIVRSMVTGIARELHLLRTQGVEGPLRVEVMEVVAFRIAQVGSFDDIFILNVFNDKNEKIARGGFSREKKYWRLAPHDSAVVEELLSRVTDGIASIPSDKISFRSLDRALQERNVQMDENLLMSVVKSAIGAPSEDESFARPSVPRLIRGQGENMDTRIQKKGETITVTDISAEASREECFGFILDINGENPQEIVNYFVARNLYEKQYQFFQANDTFRQRYEEEGRSPGEAEPI